MERSTGVQTSFSGSPSFLGVLALSGLSRRCGSGGHPESEDQPGELTAFISQIKGISEQLFVAGRTRSSK